MLHFEPWPQKHGSEFEQQGDSILLQHTTVEIIFHCKHCQMPHFLEPRDGWWCHCQWCIHLKMAGLCCHFHMLLLKKEHTESVCELELKPSNVGTQCDLWLGCPRSQDKTHELESHTLTIVKTLQWVASYPASFYQQEPGYKASNGYQKSNGECTKVIHQAVNTISVEFQCISSNYISCIPFNNLIS